MKTSEIEVLYENPNKICVKVDDKKVLLLSEDKKQITAKEIYKFLDYKKGKNYSLKDLKEFPEINDDYKNYLDEIYEIFKTIMKSL